MWDRSGCQEYVCTCHDQTAKPYFCSGCGCRPDADDFLPRAVITPSAWNRSQAAWIRACDSVKRSQVNPGRYTVKIAWLILEAEWLRATK